MSKISDAVLETRSSLTTVFRNVDLRRLNLAFAGSAIGDWAYATAMVIWAYGIGGARAVGIWFTIRLVLMTLVTPFASTLVDRLPRRTLMVALDLCRAVIAAVVAVLIWTEAPAVLVFVLATLASLASTPFRPAVAAILPSLARSPRELTAANGTTSTIDSLSFLVGPALGGLLVMWAGIPLVVALNAATFVWSAMLLMQIAATPVDPSANGPDPAAGSGADAEPADSDAATALTAEAPGAADPNQGAESFLAESLAGFRTIWADPGLRLVCGVYAAQTVVAGASAVFMIQMAAELTPLGSAGVGYLDSAMGLGAVVGGLVAISRASAQRLAVDFGIGVVFWALPLALVVVWPHMWAVLLAMVVIGIANPVVDVNAATILQRMTSDAVMGRVFGALETALIGAMAVGAAVMPLLIELIGLRWGLAVLAALVTLAVLPAFTRLHRLDATLSEPEALASLRGLPLFAPVEAKALELLAQSMVRVKVPAGQAVIREGEPGDRFYVVDSGALTATFHGDLLSHMGPGDPFGEIALLRDVPRTATVVADQPSVLFALERDAFLAAVTGNSEVKRRADDLIGKRIPT